MPAARKSSRVVSGPSKDPDEEYDFLLSENEASEDEYDPDDDFEEDFGSGKRKARGSSSTCGKGKGKGKGKAKVARKAPARKDKDNRKMPAIVIPATPAEQEALKSMLKTVNREALEKLAFDLAHEEDPVTVQLVLALLRSEEGDSKPSAMEVVESEPLGDM